MEWITDKNPIKYINTCEVKLTESEVSNCVESAIINSFKDSSNPCITKILSEVKKSLKQAYSKPIISK